VRGGGDGKSVWSDETMGFREARPGRRPYVGWWWKGGGWVGGEVGGEELTRSKKLKGRVMRGPGHDLWEGHKSFARREAGKGKERTFWNGTWQGGKE